MNDFYRQEYERWFADACRKLQLIGAIEAWTRAPLHKTPYGKPTSAGKALAEIRRLIAEYDAERATGGEHHG